MAGTSPAMTASIDLIISLRLPSAPSANEQIDFSHFSVPAQGGIDSLLWRINSLLVRIKPLFWSN
jgi:hypothetical protein